LSLQIAPNFADAATSHPEFARELPRFVACVRGLFTPQEMRTYLARIEREQTEYAAENDDEEDDESDDDYELIRESPAAPRSALASLQLSRNC
jgi:hypothetical protein